MGDLFGAEAPAPSVTHQRGAFAAAYTLDQLRAELPLRQRAAIMYGREVAVPRLECWHGTRPYAFGGRVVHPQPWPPLLLRLKFQIEQLTHEAFDSCFGNLYRDRSDTIPWHADDEAWIGEPIASVTFGAARRFRMRLKADHAVTWECELGDGDLLVMHEGVQRAWEHCVPPARGPVGPRLNLTFRRTVPHGR